jgi:NAD+ kinase
MMTTQPKIHFHAAETEEGALALHDQCAAHGQVSPEEADVIVALGGDGTLLEALHSHHGLGKPFYGMNRGSVGFMLNPYRPHDLQERIAKALKVTLRPLSMLACKDGDKEIEAIAFNEVSLLRQLHNAAKIKITIDKVERLQELVCDGILLSTPAGSTAYNLSAHGPIIPLKGNVLALTPISAFRPRRWRGALVPSHVTVRFEILEIPKRPVSATADFTEVRDVHWVEICQSKEISVDLLFDPNHTLEERILKEQFLQ